MNRRRFHTIVMTLLLTILSASAQNSTPRQIYEQAEAEYKIGRILVAKNMLESCVHNLSSTYRLGGYRLLALCCLALDEPLEARHYAELVLKENPYYTPTVEYPPRFIDMINDIKQGFTITTASSQSESISEAPTPITVITAEMIEELGYNKNLNQILAAYVPGMVEMNPYQEGESLAMHGAYSTGQELIMIMENGHCLNNHYNNVGQTSYLISTEKIDHIEVLRGPSSSLYGNVALTAVVNIITKSGRSLNGVQAKYGYGTFNTHRADLLAGTQFMDADITAWASIYYSDGQTRHFNDGKGYMSHYKDIRIPYRDEEAIYFGPDEIFVGRYKGSPSYDLGLSFKLKDFYFMFTRKKGTKNAAMAYEGGYDYDRYNPINGGMPGTGTDETHITANYAHQFKKWTLDASIYSDWFSLGDYGITFDSMIAKKIYTDEIIDSNKGIFSYDQVKENSFGGILKASTNYQIGGMKGFLLAGGQYDSFALKSRLTLYGLGHVLNSGNIDYKDMVEKGKESCLSFFIQDKHYFLPQLIMNAGLRFDSKYRHGEDALIHFSPRLALMYVPSELFSLKLSYSEAFSDLAFYYRYVFQSDLYTMDPQRLSAFQLTAMGRIAPIYLNYEFNLFYNKYSNLFTYYRSLYSKENYFKNEGRLENIGIEASASYAHKRFSGNLTFYYCHNLSSDSYYYNQTEKKVNNVPHLTFNMHGAWKMLQGKNHELKFYGNAAYRGSYLICGDTEEKDFYADPTMIIDLGLKYQYRQRLTLALDVENILNTDHYLGSLLYQDAPMFQRGRTLMGSISYAF